MVAMTVHARRWVREASRSMSFRAVSIKSVRPSELGLGRWETSRSVPVASRRSTANGGLAQYVRSRSSPARSQA